MIGKESLKGWWILTSLKKWTSWACAIFWKVVGDRFYSSRLPSRRILSPLNSTNATFVLVQIRVAVNVGFHFVFRHKSMSLILKCVPRYFGARPKKQQSTAKGQRTQRTHEALGRRKIERGPLWTCRVHRRQLHRGYPIVLPYPRAILCGLSYSYTSTFLFLMLVFGTMYLDQRIFCKSANGSQLCWIPIYFTLIHALHFLSLQVGREAA